MNDILTLDALSVGGTATVLSVSATGAMRRRLLDLGIVEGTTLECVGRSPFRDPSAFLIRGALVALRSDDSKNILVERCTDGYGTD